MPGVVDSHMGELNEHSNQTKELHKLGSVFARVRFVCALVDIWHVGEGF